MRRSQGLERLIIQFDHSLRKVTQFFSHSQQSQNHSAGLMRVNHTGEVCAQALYQGHALTVKDPAVKDHLLKAAEEENAHLDWCAERLHSLQTEPSRLNKFWTAGSYLIGALAGLAGDKVALGFVVETEKQVVQHLDNHLSRLPAEDKASRAILEQMKQDEAHHATAALEAGAVELPLPVRWLMKGLSKVMTTVAYRI